MARVHKRKKTSLLREVFDAIPDGIIVLDLSFCVLSINDSAESIFKVSRKKVVGRPCFEFLPQEIVDIAKRSIREERSVFGDTLTLPIKGKERITAQAVASPIFSQKGNPIGIVVQVRDLSGAKFLSEKTLQEISTHTFEGLIAGLAHELKNPLGGIKGAAQILKSETTSPDTIKCAEIIIKEVDRLNLLLERLKGLQPFARETFEPVDIHEILSEVIYLESKSSRKDINFIENFDVTLPPVIGDRDSLKQVFLNLVKNAIEAVSVNGTIEISTRWITDYKLKGENAISIDIKDNGIGIPKDDLEKIFTPFYTTKRKGSGLGLFLAYQIIAKHGGAIFVESEPGKGTVFRIYLPVSKQEREDIQSGFLTYG